MEWYRIDASLAGHPKVGRLARRLGKSRDYALARLVCLWGWVATYRETGDLSGLDADEIAEAAAHDGDPAGFVEALIAAEWLDRGDDGALTVHDWAERNGAALAHRDASRAHRARKAAARVESEPERSVADASDQRDITVTSPCHHDDVAVRPTYVRTDVRTDRQDQLTTFACAETARPSSAPDARCPLFACDGPTPTWQATADRIESWVAAYPSLDVPGELTRAAAWIEASPERRKTARGMARFLVGWLGRAQDRRAAATRPAEAPRRRSASEREAAEMAALGRRRGGKSEDRLSADLEALRVVAAEARPVESSYQILRAAEVRLSDEYADHPRAGELRGAITAAEIALDRAAEREAATC